MGRESGDKSDINARELQVMHFAVALSAFRIVTHRCIEIIHQGHMVHSPMKLMFCPLSLSLDLRSLTLPQFDQYANA